MKSGAGVSGTLTVFMSADEATVSASRLLPNMSMNAESAGKSISSVAPLLTPHSTSWFVVQTGITALAPWRKQYPRTSL